MKPREDVDLDVLAQLLVGDAAWLTQDMFDAVADDHGEPPATVSETDKQRVFDYFTKLLPVTLRDGLRAKASAPRRL